ncbi:MAG TPA: MATE family efflux transporter [Flavobacteriales bacterium]|nr:MATE family efflux transporter [Flavobacteriales bacterium]
MSYSDDDNIVLPEKGVLSYGAILRMTLPVMFGMLAEFIVAIINSAFLSRIDEGPNQGSSMVASGNASLLYITIIMISYGLAGAAQILIARRDGEKNTKGIAETMWNTFVLVGILHVVLFIAIKFGSRYLFDAAVASPVVEEKMNAFMGIRSYGIFFSILEMGFFAYYTGTGKTLPVMFATIVQGATNFLFDYCLIFGHFGFPEMGLEGAAWSTTISDGCAGLTYVLFFVFSKKDIEIKRFFKNKVSGVRIREIVKLGIPLIGQGFVSVGSWTIFFFMIENMGQKQIEISQTIRNFYYICLASVLSFGTVTKTIVSKLLAEKRVDDIKPTMKRIIGCSLFCTFVFTHANFFYPAVVIPIINSHAEILQDTILTLQLVSLAMVMFAVSVALISMISGAGDTKASFMIEFISILLYTIMGWLVTVVYPQPIYLVWCIEYVYFCFMILLALLYLRRGTWKSIKI